MDDRFRKILVFTVLAVWVASFVLSIVVHSYKPPPEITSALLAVLGLVGLSQVGGGRNNDRDGDGNNTGGGSNDRQGR